MKKVNNELQQNHDKLHDQYVALTGKIKELSEINKELMREASLKEKGYNEKGSEDR